MALRGSLSDMSVGDVLQLPMMGAKTGELRVHHEGQTASLYYRDGRMVHGVFGDKRDEEVLVEVLGWAVGEFAFEQGTQPPAETLKDDLHLLLMRAAKRRDESKKKAASRGTVSLASKEVEQALREALQSHKGFSVISFVSRDGKQLSAVPADAPGAPVAVEFAVRCFALADKPPRSPITRCWVEDDHGHCLWLRLGAEVSLVVLAAPTVNMGSLMLAANKVGSGLKTLLAEGAA